MKLTSTQITTIIMAVLALVAFWVAYSKGQHGQGLTIAKNLLLQVLPLLIFAFILAGMLQTLIPPETISRWVGAKSGFRGILIGTLTGAVLPGGPYVTLPVLAGLMKIGTSIPVLVTMLTSWSLLAVMRLPIEISVMGIKFMLIRLASVFIFAPLAGLIAQAVMKIFKLE